MLFRRKKPGNLKKFFQPFKKSRQLGEGLLKSATDSGPMPPVVLPWRPMAFKLGLSQARARTKKTPPRFYGFAMKRLG